MRVRFFICFAVLLAGSLTTSVFGQAFEVSPYAGYYWPGDNTGVGEFKSTQLLGIRGGGYVSPTVELGLNYNWINHFQPSSSNARAALAGDLGFPQGTVKSHLWEAEFTYNFAKRNMFGSTVSPYVVVGGGALRTNINDPDTFVLNVRQVSTPLRTTFVRNDVMESGDTFFTFSYGGGVKLRRIVGPMGFFGDLRGRSVPNFFGHGTNSPELSAGLNFVWGER